MFAEWLAYFSHNRRERFPIDWERGVNVDPALRGPLARSLQRFQLGESGDGAHLKKVARSLHDPDYAAAIYLFVEEEQEHAELMARVLRRLDFPLLQKHWTDGAFRILCLVSNLYLELLLLVVTEVIAKRYFRMLHDSTPDLVLRAVCSQILHDEEAHIAFHCAALQTGLSRLPAVTQGPVRFIWGLFFEGVTIVVLADHRPLLDAVGVSPAQFRRDCRAIFRRSTAAVFASPARSAGIGVQ